MNLPGLHGEGEQFPVPEQSFLKTGAVADDNVLRVEYRAREMMTIGSTENFDQVLLTLEVPHQLMNQPNVFHGNPNGGLMQETERLDLIKEQTSRQDIKSPLSATSLGKNSV